MNDITWRVVWPSSVVSGESFDASYAVAQPNQTLPNCPISSMETIRIAETDRDIQACFPVMQQLRTHLIAADFVPTLRRQIAGGYTLALLEIDGKVCALAGYRLLDNLASGRVLYVDDLVTASSKRSQGYGGRLLAWLVDRARESGCKTLELDSGVHRHDAHRFYLAGRMEISSYHFRLRLTDGTVA
jgi:GNAT superfamily N-acetyltransferase